MATETKDNVVELPFTRDAHRWPFQLDETGDDSEFRVVKTDLDGNVVGDFIFATTDDGDVIVVCRRFDEAEFGSVNLVVV